MLNDEGPVGRVQERIRAAGSTHLKAQTEQWVKYAGAVTGVLTSSPKRA